MNSILHEGGAYGHLMHLYDNRDLTFAELKKVLSAASRGKLEKATEKTDGMNLVFSWSVPENRLKVARSGGDIKGGGMDAAKLAARFQDRGNITEAFNSAFKVLADAISTIPDAVKIKVFGKDANFWYSIEVIYSLNPNVINYDKNYLVFHAHGYMYLDKSGNVMQETDAVGIDLLEAYIEKMQAAVAKSSWQISAPQIARFKSLSDKSILASAVAKISAAQASAGVSDSGTIDDYLHVLFTREASKLKFPKNVTSAIVSRCLGDPGAPGLVEIKKLVGKEGYLATSEFVKSSQAMLTSFIEPIEMAIHEFSVELLKGLKSVMVASHDEEVQRLKSEVSAAIAAIEASGNQQAIDVLDKQLRKLGGIDKIASSAEGVVFRYKGNAYKFTGSFAPVNQILGLFKYGRKGVKITPTVQTSENLRRLIRRLIETAPPTFKSPSAEFDDLEMLAKKEYELAKAQLKAWDDADQAIKTWEAAGGKKTGKPKPKYPDGMSSSSRQKLTAKFERAEEIYADYDPAVKKYVSRRTASAATKNYDPADVPDQSKPQITDIGDVKAFVWYPWPGNISSHSKTKYDDPNKRKVGIGPGEEWLAGYFGGNVMGPSRSYDLVTKDGKRWEVKALERPSETIRPGTEGRRAIEAARRRLNSILLQMRNFIVVAKNLGFMDDMSHADRSLMLKYVNEFLEDNYDWIVTAGEVSIERIVALRSTLKTINDYCATTGVGDIKKTTGDVIGLNDREINVDKQTFIDVTKRVEKSTGQKDLLSQINKDERLLSTLKDKAFTKRSEFLDEWYESVDVNKVFEDVDGVFVVNTKGFVMIPKSRLKEGLKFLKISQGTPRFALRIPHGP